MPQIDWKAKFPNMTPVRKAPPLRTINGIGMSLCGTRDKDAQTGAYLATLCFTILFIPIFCIRSYRVIKAESNSWYFLGREPLSLFAKSWNGFVVMSLLAIGGSFALNAYMDTDAYKARQQMSKAADLVNQGKLADAARIYTHLINAQKEESQNAIQALKTLIDTKSLASPLDESAGLFTAAAQVSTRNGNYSNADLLSKGMDLIKSRGNSDPRGALALLQALRVLALDPRPIDDARLPLLQKWVADEPANIDPAIQLASIYEDQDKLEEAGKLLVPLKDKLGTGEGARVLGVLYSRQGKYDDAYALLWPYVKSRLDRLHQAEKAANDTEEAIANRELELLRQNKGPQDFYDRYERSSEDQKQAMVREYVGTRMRSDPEYVTTQEALERETSVVPVTLELGMTMLQRAQAQSNPAERKKQLEATQEIFLAVKGFAGESDEYRMFLGQVYYWLGKQDEGRKLFDEFIASKSRSADSLFQVAIRLRDLGADPEARTMIEEAYAKAPSNELRFNAAMLRALLQKNVDDEIEWLTKADPDDPTVKARLATSLGSKAFEQGRDDEAARQYHLAIDAYAAMPRSTMTLNDASLVYEQLFQISGDLADLDHGVDAMQQAVNLDPSDPVLLFNTAAAIYRASLTDLAGNQIDLRTLHRRADSGLLSFLYVDQAGRDALVQKFSTHPGIAKALNYLDKVMVISPKNGRAYSLAYDIHHFTHNEAALRALELRMTAAGIDAADTVESFKQHLAGTRDAVNQETMAAGAKRLEETARRVRAAGGLTAAVAITDQVAALIGLDFYTKKEDAEKMVALAEEAYRIAPCPGTSDTLGAAYFQRAAKTLRREDPAIDAWCKASEKTLNSTYVLTIALQDENLQQKIKQNPDVQKAIALTLADKHTFPAIRTVIDWAAIHAVDAAEGNSFADIIRQNPRLLIEQSINHQLSPASVSGAYDASWLYEILKKPAESKAALNFPDSLGVPVPKLR